jgi:hypothetical protein
MSDTMFDTRLFKVVSAIEELTRQDKAVILDNLLVEVVLYEHYKKVFYKTKPNETLIDAITNLKQMLKTTEYQRPSPNPESPAASSTSLMSGSGTL